jgi:hypothetical protein
MAEKAAVGRGREKKKKEKKRRENTHSDQNAGMAERASTPSSICLSDPQGPDEVIARAQSSIKKGVYLRSIDDRARERRVLTLYSPVAHRRSPCSRGVNVKAVWCR